MVSSRRPPEVRGPALFQRVRGDHAVRGVPPARDTSHPHFAGGRARTAGRHPAVRHRLRRSGRNLYSRLHPRVGYRPGAPAGPPGGRSDRRPGLQHGQRRRLLESGGREHGATGDRAGDSGRGGGPVAGRSGSPHRQSRPNPGRAGMDATVSWPRRDGGNRMGVAPRPPERLRGMIISRTPLRVSFTGGGSDLPAIHRHEPGAVLSTAIKKYIYITVNRKFDHRIRASYSITEIVDSVDELKHELIREALRVVGVDSGIEITSISDIPSQGTGLGSSSTYTVGLAKKKKTQIKKQERAARAG